MDLIEHEPVLFNESIGANIDYGKEGKVTCCEIGEAAAPENAHGFIGALTVMH